MIYAIFYIAITIISGVLIYTKYSYDNPEYNWTEDAMGGLCVLCIFWPLSLIGYITYIITKKFLESRK